MAEHKKEYYVASRVDSGKMHEDCIIYGPDEVIPATHRNVYGPDTRKKCEEWAADNCENNKR